jgi:hypothetical protein
MVELAIMSTNASSALLLLTFLLMLSPSLARADEPTPVQDILANPDAYHLRLVTVHGTARDIEPLDPYILPSGVTCYGAYLFRLDDETGSLPVAVLGVCGVPVFRDPEVEEGDRVTVTATIQAPGHGSYYLTLEGFRISTAERGQVQAIATKIERFAE